MTSRERVVRTLGFEAVDRAPRDLWYPPGIKLYRESELSSLLQKYPLDFAAPDYHYGTSHRARGQVGVVGSYVDAWGCVFSVGEPGVIGEVTEPPLNSWVALDSYRLPWELLTDADLSQVNRSCMTTSSYVRVGTETRPMVTRKSTNYGICCMSSLPRRWRCGPKPM